MCSAISERVPEFLVRCQEEICKGVVAGLRVSSKGGEVPDLCRGTRGFRVRVETLHPIPA